MGVKVGDWVRNLETGEEGEIAGDKNDREWEVQTVFRRVGSPYSGYSMFPKSKTIKVARPGRGGVDDS